MAKRYTLERGFMIEYAWESSLRSLSPKEFHRVFWALCDYQKSGGSAAVPGIQDGKSGLVCSLIVPQINNRLNGAAGGRKSAEMAAEAEEDTEGTAPPAAESASLKIQKQKQVQLQPQLQSQFQKNAGEAAHRPPSAEHTHTEFVPPTAEEVEEYCRERGITVDVQHFLDYYASKGWTVGKTPMKDWQAALRNWERTTPAFFTSQASEPSGWDYIEAVARGEAV